ncbi:hypothetical protein CBL_13669 [Carabus blaptoides fortunei]
MENFLKKADEEKDLNINNNDLQGLWDMTCIEIDDLETKFKYLDTIKANNWKKPTTVYKSPKSTKKQKPRKTQRNTRKDPSNRPTPSLTRPIEALSRRPTSDRRSGQIETNTIKTTTSRPKSSTAIPSEVPCKRPKSSSISPQDQIVIVQIKAKKQIYDKRKSIINRSKHITSDNEDKFFDAK